MRDLAGNWSPDSLNAADSEVFWRARLILAATGLVSFFALFSAMLQMTRGSVTASYFGWMLLALCLSVPVLLRYTGSLTLAGNVLCALLFLGLSVVNFASAGTTPGAEITLVLVPAIAWLVPGRTWPTFWALLVCAEILLIPHLGSLGLPDWIHADPALSAEAIHRIPLLIVLFTLVCGIATDRISTATNRTKVDTERLLEQWRADRERLELEMLERKRNLAAVGTLAASMAHQINNPVGSILAAAQYAKLMKNDPEHEFVAHDAFDLIESEAQRCGRIVHSLLRVSRGDPSQKWEEDLNPIVQNAVNAALPYARERSGRLDVELASGSVPLLVNPIEMEQAIVNLVRNGVEACDAEARILVRTVTASDHVRIEVTDNGRGLSDNEREHVFDPFYTMRHAEGGSGLGLSVVKRVVEDHGGSVRAHARPDGDGMTFEIELPLSLPADRRSAEEDFEAGSAASPRVGSGIEPRGEGSRESVDVGRPD